MSYKLRTLLTVLGVWGGGGGKQVSRLQQGRGGGTKLTIIIYYYYSSTIKVGPTRYLIEYAARELVPALVTCFFFKDKVVRGNLQFYKRKDGKVQQL